MHSYVRWRRLRTTSGNEFSAKQVETDELGEVDDDDVYEKKIVEK